MDAERESLASVGAFLSEYAAHLIGCGVHTSRVVRNSKRIGDAYGYGVNICVFQKHIVLAVHDEMTHETYNDVVDIPVLPISFTHNADLSALSWRIYDEHISLAEAWREYRKVLVCSPLNRWVVLLLTAVANASFCALFGGDVLAMSIVFVATLVGVLLKQCLTTAHVNNYIVFALVSFVASMCASVSLLLPTTAEIALTTSVLFLIPGVPIINGVTDILEGYVLNGFSRLARAAMLVVCIAVGLSVTLMLVKHSLL